MNFRKLLNALKDLANKIPGRKPTAAELDKATKKAVSKSGVTFESLPDEIIGEVLKQRRQDARRQVREGTSERKALRIWQPPVEEPAAVEELPNADLLMGRMRDVQSSNVHSIGMRVEQPSDRTGTLLIRYLGTLPGGIRSGPGSLYGYYDVPVTLFRELGDAASKGIFVWDNVRVRGTISGHRYQYELLGINAQFAGGQMHQNYVPRQAAILRGQAGEHYIRRKFTIYRAEEGGRAMRPVVIHSQLTPQQASMRGPNPDRGPGVQGLRLEAGRQGGRE
jgi:hypothetical protein